MRTRKTIFTFYMIFAIITILTTPLNNGIPVLFGMLTVLLFIKLKLFDLGAFIKDELRDLKDSMREQLKEK